MTSRAAAARTSRPASRARRAHNPSASRLHPSPSSNGLHLGPLFIHAYGLAYVLAVLAAVAITVRRWQARGGRRELVYEVALWGFPAGLIGARIYFLATS